MRVRLLDHAPTLAQGLPAAELAAAARSLTVPVLKLDPGPWRASVQPSSDQLGLLVLGGILLREIHVGRHWSSEVLGEGDLLRPWQEDVSSFAESHWEVLQPVRLAVLDAAAVAELRAHPALIHALFERAINRSRSLAIQAVAEGIPRVDERLWMMLWYLAERLGERRGDSVVIPVSFTHAQLARLVGARRPTVSTALGKLERAGRVARLADGGWRITGEPPGAEEPS